MDGGWGVAMEGVGGSSMLPYVQTHHTDYLGTGAQVVSFSSFTQLPSSELDITQQFHSVPQALAEPQHTSR